MSKTAHDLTRKDMKAPDRFQVAATQAAGWTAAHSKQLLAALGALTLVGAAALAFTSWRSSQATSAGALLYRTLAAADGQISSVPLPGVSGLRFASEAERQKAVVEAARTVRDQYPSTRAATTAALAEGDARYRLGEWDAARAAYQAFLDGSPAEDALRFAALDGIARVHEAKGQLAEAAQAWQRAGEAKPFADRATLERARVLARAGQIEEARKLLAGFADRFKDSPLRAEADERLAALGR